ncbi:hypothetical protein EQG63_10270 [Flavobacterium amnicola]|uniref:Adenylosuccinate lyase n=1 Tax=Flavobacterium amnicola TaxID=2506422 RepID=A0A4Q1K262_9FLAO|nr:hypothetical protein [Flavobacterium amnicola]RXR17859.1 hypothetical protein EQG63_10270 [Flavobacterium amnicola]
MKSEFYQLLENCTIARKERDKMRNLVIRKPEFIPELCSIAFDLKEDIHIKAYWVLELISEKKLKLLVPYIEDFCETVPKLTDDSAKRTASHIIFYLAKSNHRANGINLTQLQETQIIEMCFDWLIRDEKVATKVYAIKALFVLGKKYDWIHPELKNIIQQDYTTHTAAYQAATRIILKKIK